MSAARLLNTTRTNYQMGQSMSDESQFTKPESGRPLRPEEVALIRALLAGVYPAEALEGALKDSVLLTCKTAEWGVFAF